VGSAGVAVTLWLTGATVALASPPGGGVRSARSGAEEAVDPDVHQARALLRAGDPLQATYWLSSLLARKPDSVPALNALASALLALDDPLSAYVAAERASRLDPSDPESHALLGDALAGLDAHTGAMTAYERSLELRPDSGVREKLMRVSRGSAVAGPHLRIRYEGGVNAPLGEAVLRIVDSAYQEYVERLGFAPGLPVTVVLQTQAEFGGGEVPGWAAGINDGDIRIPVQGLDAATPGLVRVLRHELTHSFVAARTGDNCPTWLHEGLAQWLEGGSPERGDVGLAAAAQAGHLMPLVSLEGPFRKLSEAEATLAYAESLSAVAHILRQHGEQGVGRLIAALADQRPAHRALSEALGQSYSQLQRSWETHLRDLAAPPP
jgi:tetratricopeptide (TPR) repeat protein